MKTLSALLLLSLAFAGCSATLGAVCYLPAHHTGECRVTPPAPAAPASAPKPAQP